MSCHVPVTTPPAVAVQKRRIPLRLGLASLGQSKVHPPYSSLKPSDAMKAASSLKHWTET